MKQMTAVGPADTSVAMPLQVDALAFVILASLCLLVPTNGIGSNGMVLSFLWVLLRQPAARRDWWQVLWPLALAAFVYLLVLGAMAFSPRHGLKDSWSVFHGVMLSLLGVYLAQLPIRKLRDTAYVVVGLMTAFAIAVLLYNFHHNGVAVTLQLGGLDWWVNRNRLAVGFGLSFVLATVFAVTAESQTRRAVLLACAAVLLATSYINNCRGALLGMIAAAGLMALYWNWRLTVALGVLAAVGLAVLWEQGALMHLISHNGTIDSGRGGMWHGVMDRIGQRPWTGYGLHALPYDPVYQAQYGQLQLGHTHSIYLDLLYSSGIIGVLFWVGWFTALSLRLRAAISVSAVDVRHLGVGLLAYTLVHGLVDFGFYELGISIMIVLGWTCMAVARRQPVPAAGVSAPA